MDTFEDQRDELFQEKTGGEALPKGWQFEDLSEEVQSLNLKTLARVVIEIGAHDAPKVEKNMADIETSVEEREGKIEAIVKCEGKPIAKMNFENKEEGWRLEHRYCQPEFRGRMIMTTLLKEVEEVLKKKGVKELRMGAIKVLPISWALKRGFEIEDDTQRADTFKALRARGWSGSAQEFLDYGVELKKDLD